MKDIINRVEERSYIRIYLVHTYIIYVFKRLKFGDKIKTHQFKLLSVWGETILKNDKTKYKYKMHKSDQKENKTIKFTKK